MDFDEYDGEVHFKEDDVADCQHVGSLSEKKYGRKLAYWLTQSEVWESILHNMTTSLDVYNRINGYSSRYLVISLPDSRNGETRRMAAPPRSQPISGDQQRPHLA